MATDTTPEHTKSATAAGKTQGQAFLQGQPTTLNMEPARATDRFQQWSNIFTFVSSVGALGWLSYFFHATTALASVPLVGLVAFLLSWPLYQKLHALRRISVEFETGQVGRVAVKASNNGKDEVSSQQEPAT